MTDGFQLALRQANAYESRTGAFMAPSAKLMVDALALRPGDAFVDLACGTGLLARHAWRAIGKHGLVLGVDINRAMLEVAQSICDETGIVWAHSSAEHLPVRRETITHVACQQGLQFFPDALASVREVHRVLRPGGVFAATIWNTPGQNPYIETQLELLVEVSPGVSASARVAMPADADQQLAGWAEGAGFSLSEVSLLEHVVEIADLKAYFLAQTASTPWAPVVAALEPREQMRLADRFVERLSPYRNRSGGHALPFRSFLLTASK